MEIITGVARRRRWRDEDKLRILAEADGPGAVIADVATHKATRRRIITLMTTPHEVGHRVIVIMIYQRQIRVNTKAQKSK